MDKPTDYESVLRSSNLLRGTRRKFQNLNLNRNLKYLIPALLSLVLFSSLFVISMYNNSGNQEEKLQISPKKLLYEEKFGKAHSYEYGDITTAGLMKNVRLNDTCGVSEPKIICNPKNPNILAVSANDFSDNAESGCVFISENGGLNWQTKRVPMSLKFKRSLYSDPWLEYDSYGNLYFTAVQLDIQNKGKEGIFIARSTDDGTNWKTDFNFIDYNGKVNIYLDRPKIYIDKTPGHNNSINISWYEINGFESYVMFSRSTDGGNSFTPPFTIEKHDVKYNSLTGDQNGNLYIVYLKNEKRLSVKKSTDGGKFWGKEFSYLDIIPSGTKNENQYVIKNSEKKGIRVNSEPSLCISENNDLMITLSASGKGSDLSDIYFTKLENNSNALTKPVKVNSDVTNNDQFFPTVTSDKSGNIFIMYQDSRNDINNIITETYLSYSNDGGLTFTDEKLSTADFDPLSIAIDRYVSDYNSCVISGGYIVGVWTDGRNNNFDIYAGILNLKDFFENTSH